MEHKPALLSIITPTYNCASQLERTIASLRGHDKIFEHVIVDGISTDGTLKVIQHYAESAEYPVRWVSENDSGIYDAMNKGIGLSRGKFLLFLNAGDLLSEDVLCEIKPMLPQSALSMLYGNALMEGGHVYGAPFDKAKIAKLNICHQAIFYGREVFQRIGKFDLRYPVLADHAFNIRCFADERIEKKYIPRIIAEYEAGGFSAQNRDEVFARERIHLIKANLGWKALLIYHIFDWESHGPKWARALIRGVKSAAKRVFSLLTKRRRTL